MSAYDEDCASTPDQANEYPSTDTSNALLWVPCTNNPAGRETKEAAAHLQMFTLQPD
jgi:hypothetical protein